VVRTAVIGTTSWGTTLAVLTARNGHEVALMARDPAEADALTAAGENVRHRKGLSFPPSLTPTFDPEALATAEVIVIAVPSSSLRANLTRLAPAFAPEAAVLSASKGIEPESCLRMSQVVRAFGIEDERLLVLSGPNFADEIAAGLPAASVVAGNDAGRARQAQLMLSGPSFRLYTSDDVAGVELGGALKNVVAIACGLSDGLGYGANARAGLITRALAEMTRIGVAAGARPLTFLGLAGIGDLLLSCTSDTSRNRRLGLALARGLGLEDACTAVAGLTEGAVTARAVPLLARRFGVELPICEALHAVLFEAKEPAAAGRELMARSFKPELDAGGAPAPA
jgi:glycerol-3-phosphate dehydrogenase (NAD(P)+)